MRRHYAPTPALAGLHRQHQHHACFRDPEVSGEQQRRQLLVELLPGPLALGTDYLVSGDCRSRTAALQISLDQGRTAGDPTKIISGYTLQGRKKSNGYELSYAAPFGVGATVDASQQAWVNSIWTNVVGVPIAVGSLLREHAQDAVDAGALEQLLAAIGKTSDWSSRLRWEDNRA